MPKTGRLTTADELLRFPDNGKPCELVKGEVRTMTPAGFNHGAVVINLTLPLGRHVKERRLGVLCGAETGFILATNPDTVRAPDISFVCSQRLPEAGLPAGYWPGAPDLAVEVLSPGDTTVEVDEKVNDWLAAGADAVWVVNPKSRTVVVHQSGAAARTLLEHDTLEGGTIVPGFRLRVGDIFTI